MKAAELAEVKNMLLRSRILDEDTGRMRRHLNTQRATVKEVDFLLSQRQAPTREASPQMRRDNRKTLKDLLELKSTALFRERKLESKIRANEKKMAEIEERAGKIAKELHRRFPTKRP